MKLGDTVRVKTSGDVGVITEIGSYYPDGRQRWVVHLARTMREHIFQEMDLAILGQIYCFIFSQF